MVSASIFLVVVSWFSGASVNAVVKETQWILVFRQLKIISGFSPDYARAFKEWRLQNVFQFFNMILNFCSGPENEGHDFST